VDGVYTTDPRVAQDARKIEKLSHDEMLELASLGAMVLHPRAVEIGKIHNTDIIVRNSHNREEGTIVTHEKIEKDSVVTGVAFDKNTSKISLLKVPDKPGIAANLFKSLSDNSINVDMIVQSTHEEINHNDISFTVSKDDYQLAFDICQKVGKELGCGEVLGDENVAKVSIVGVGMISTPGVAADMFRLLGDNNINIDMISTSEIKVSCIIAKDDLEKAVKALNKELTK
jgi:aspartate kinase